MRKITTYLGAFALSLLMFASCGKTAEVTGDDYRVIPLPNEVTVADGQFALTSGTEIVYTSADLQKEANFLAEYIEESTSLDLTTREGEATQGAILLSTGLESDNAEAYTLTVDANGVSIKGASAAGVFYGVQTLRKALPTEKCSKVMLAAVEVNDAPRFGYRGAHLDVGRHFFTTDSVKRFIDMIALHNMNRMHWHLTEDQGWRIEIPEYPKLTEVGSVRKETVIGRNSGKYDGTPHGGFYTQDELREVVAYAADRHITIIPEVDLPGHMVAALAAYPEMGCTGGPYEVMKEWGISDDVLCAGNDKVYKFIEDVLNVVTDIFPSEYIHVGGDECPKVRWKDCPKCQAKIKELGIKADDNHSAEEYLQSHVITFASEVLAKKGRKMIGWDEILEGGLAEGATVMSWRGESGGITAARMGHDVIMTPNTYMYFDYYQTADVEDEPLAIGGCLPVKDVYNYEPMSSQLKDDEHKYIIGVQANLWTEYVPTYRHAEYMALPRYAALSEVQWTKPENKDYNDFLSRIPALIAKYDMKGYNYARHLMNVNVTYCPNQATGKMGVVMTAIDNAPIHYTLDGSEPTAASSQYTDTLWLDKSAQLRAMIIRGNGNSKMYTEDIEFTKSTLKPIEMLQPINPGYMYKGAITLVDGLVGGESYKSGRYIAFVGNDLEAVIDLQAEEEISKVSINCCYNTGDWVCDARSMSVAVSADGETFTEIAKEEYPKMVEKDYGSGIKTHTLKFAPSKARYVKVTVAPEYDQNQNPGQNGFIFVDEIKVY